MKNKENQPKTVENPARPVASPGRQEEKPSKLPWILMYVLIALLLGGCIWFFVFYTGKTVSKSRDRDDDVEKTDDAADALAAALEGKVADGQSTPDLAYHELKGPVKVVREGYDYDYGLYYGDQYFYTPDGALVNLPTWNPGEASYFPGQTNKVEKDANGYIVKISENTSPTGFNNKTTMAWENGRLISTHETSESIDPDWYYYGTTDTDYSYNESGDLLKKSEKRSYYNQWGGGDSEETYRYSYLEYDDHGNWTKRQVANTWNYDGSTGNNTYIEVRHITYY